MTTVAINLPDGLTFNKGTASLLNNTASQAVVNLTGITGGFINVVVDIDAGTDVRQEFILLFSKNAVGSTWSISTLSTTGENSLTTFDIDTSGILRASVGSHAATYTSGTCTYSINAPALGTAFPAMISASNVLGSTTGVAPAAGVIGQSIEAQPALLSQTSGTTANIGTINLTQGRWRVDAKVGAIFANTNVTITSINGVISTVSASFSQFQYSVKTSMSVLTGDGPAITVMPRVFDVGPGGLTIYIVGNLTSASGAIDYYSSYLLTRIG